MTEKSAFTNLPKIDLILKSGAGESIFRVHSKFPNSGAYFAGGFLDVLELES